MQLWDASREAAWGTDLPLPMRISGTLKAPLRSGPSGAGPDSCQLSSAAQHPQRGLIRRPSRLQHGCQRL